MAARISTRRLKGALRRHERFLREMRRSRAYYERAQRRAANGNLVEACTTWTREADAAAAWGLEVILQLGALEPIPRGWQRLNPN